MVSTPMLRGVAFTLLFLFFVGAGMANAQVGSADVNNDGFVSKAEAAAQSQAHFNRMDANKDGVIDAAELAKVKAMFAQRAPQMAQMMDRMDLDGDGRVTKAESATISSVRFGRVDTNRDGKWDAGEQVAMRKAMGF